MSTIVPLAGTSNYPSDASLGCVIKMRYFPKGTGINRFSRVAGKSVIQMLADDGTKINGMITTDPVPNYFLRLMRTIVTAVSSNSADADQSKDYGEGLGSNNSRDVELETVTVKLQSMTGNAVTVFWIPTTAVNKATVLGGVNSSKHYRNLARQILQRVFVDGSQGYTRADAISIDGVSYRVADLDMEAEAV